MTKVISIALSITMMLCSSTGTNELSRVLTTSTPVNVQKQQAVWEQYTVIESELKKKFEFSPWREGVIMSNWEEVTLGYYDWRDKGDPTNLKINLIGSQKIGIGGLGLGKIAYQGGGDAVTEIEKTGLHDNIDTLGRARNRTIRGVSYRDREQGSYLGEITGDLGKYPDNGEHEDGFWYVLKEVKARC